MVEPSGERRTQRGGRGRAGARRELLRNAALMQLRAAWQRYSLSYVDGAMTLPNLSLGESSVSRLGAWNRDRRAIRLSERHVFEDSWTDVMATLRHEMAHQYVDEVLGAHDEPPHGPSFREACRLLRTDPAATATGIEPADGSERNDLLVKLTKLLALSRSPNAHEAEAALAKARDFMQMHQLDPDDVAAIGRGDEPSARRLAVRSVGPIRKRHQAWRAALGNLLSDHFAVECLWVHAYEPETCTEGRVLNLYGRRDHLEFACYVHDWIAGEGGALDRLWAADKDRRCVRSNADRQRFFEGALRGFREALDESAARRADPPIEARDRASVEESALRTSAEHSALTRQQRELRAFLEWHHPHVRSHSVGGRAAGSGAYERGQRAGKSLQLHRPLGGGTGGTPKRIGPG